MSSIVLCIDGKVSRHNVYNSTLCSILENFRDDGDETIITVTVIKGGENLDRQD